MPQVIPVPECMKQVFCLGLLFALGTNCIAQSGGALPVPLVSRDVNSSADVVFTKTASRPPEEDVVAPATSTAISDSQFFVQQQYRDFLNRDPDTSGFNFWTNEIENCGSDVACRGVKRINVSAAFFLSIEFRETGFFVYRLYKACYGRMPRLAEFITDTREIGKNVVVGNSGWQQQVEANKQAFILKWTSRYDFKRAYPTVLSPSAYVDNLFQNTAVTPSTADRSTLIGGLSSGAETRESVLRKVVENQIFSLAETNKAFVLMQYFGYLRRNPDDAPDKDLSGYNFWLTKLNQLNGDFIQAEMVKAFLSSTEYVSRFDQPLVLTKRNATPGESLTINGSGFNSNLVTTVTFTGDNGYLVKMSAVNVTSTSLEVGVPPYVNMSTFALGPGNVIASVEQRSSGQTIKLGSTGALQIRDLPQLASTPGRVTLEVLTRTNTLAKSAADTWQRIEGYSSGKVSATALVSSLTRTQDDLRNMSSTVQQLAGGQLAKLSLGTVNGQQITLDKAALLTLDRIYFAYLLDGVPAGAATLTGANTVTEKYGVQLAVDSDDDVTQAVDNSHLFTSSGMGGANDDVAAYAQKIAFNLGGLGAISSLVALGAESTLVVAAATVLGVAFVGGALVAGAIAFSANSFGAAIENRSSSGDLFRGEAATLVNYPQDMKPSNAVKNYQASGVGQNLIDAENDAFDSAQQFNDQNPSSLASQIEAAFSSLNAIGSVLAFLNFGNALLGNISQVANGGINYLPCSNCITVTIRSVMIVGQDSDQFHIASDGCTGFSTSGGAGCNVGIFFLPTRPGPAHAYLQLNDGRIWLNDLKGSGN